MNQEQTWLLRDKYNGIPSALFERDLERLQAGEPLAYVIGWVSFLMTKIYLDSKPLIPRPETEYWVGVAIEAIKNRNIAEPKILDLCAGSGCVGVGVLKAIPESRVDFVELDERHHETIKKNIRESGIGLDRVRIIGGSLFENIKDSYDAILTNPPYINPLLEKNVQKSVLRHEPNLALFGGKNGMELITEILELSPTFLNPGGVLFIEHEPEQEDAIKKLLPGTESFKDQFDVVRFSVFKN